MRQTFADDRSTRAAWALAMCAPAPQGDIVDPLCWANFSHADPDAAGFLRTEVIAQHILYSGLEASNPVRLHLQELSKAMAGAPLQTDGKN